MRYILEGEEDKIGFSLLDFRRIFSKNTNKRFSRDLVDILLQATIGRTGMLRIFGKKAEVFKASLCLVGK